MLCYRCRDYGNVYVAHCREKPLRDLFRYLWRTRSIATFMTESQMFNTQLLKVQDRKRTKNDSSYLRCVKSITANSSPTNLSVNRPQARHGCNIHHNYNQQTVRQHQRGRGPSRRGADLDPSHCSRCCLDQLVEVANG
jgi:hypothetical protein